MKNKEINSSGIKLLYFSMHNRVRSPWIGKCKPVQEEMLITQAQIKIHDVDS